MHIIDEVLEPLTALPTAKTEINNLDALQFIQKADQLSVGDNKLRTYRSQLALMKKESLYNAPGAHTFLLPVDEGFKVSADIRQYICLLNYSVHRLYYYISYR